jgi:hypothetical protein
VNVQQPGQGWTALIMASQSGRDDTVSFLISKGADPNIALNDGKTALHLAVERGSVETVSALLAASAKVAARTKIDPAVQYPDKEQYERVTEPGFVLSGQTPFQELAERWNGKIAELLLKNGSHVDETDDNGWTALHWACKYGNPDAAKALLDLGANVNALSKHGNTPLHNATHALAGFPAPDVMRILLARGANRSAKNADGLTPLAMLRRDVGYILQNAVDLEPRQDKWEQIFLKDANYAAKLLDPNAPQITLPTPLPKSNITTFHLEFGASSIKAQVVRDKGYTTLRLVIPKEEADGFIISDITLDYYDPLTSLPVKVDRETRSALIKFPPAAGKDGYLSFTYASPSGSGTMYRASGSEVALFDRLPAGGVQIKSVVQDRAELIRIDTLSLAEHKLSRYSGQILAIKPAGEVKIPGFVLRKADANGEYNCRINYSYRVLPNVKWRHGWTVL